MIVLQETGSGKYLAAKTLSNGVYAEFTSNRLEAWQFSSKKAAREWLANPMNQYYRQYQFNFVRL